MAGAVLERDGIGESQDAFLRGCKLGTQLFIFEGRLAELFLRLKTSILEEVSQSCFVSDASFQIEASLAEKHRFSAVNFRI